MPDDAPKAILRRARRKPGQMLVNATRRGPAAARRKQVVITFGSTTTVLDGIDPEAEARGAAEGEAALLRFFEALDTLPGLKMVEEKGIPYFRAHPDRLDWIIRRLDGVETVGVVDAEGVFQPIG